MRMHMSPKKLADGDCELGILRLALFLASYMGGWDCGILVTIDSCNEGVMCDNFVASCPSMDDCEHVKVETCSSLQVVLSVGLADTVQFLSLSFMTVIQRT